MLRLGDNTGRAPQDLADQLALAASSLRVLHDAGFRDVLLVCTPASAVESAEAYASTIGAFGLLTNYVVADLRDIDASAYPAYVEAVRAAGAVTHIVHDGVAHARKT